MEAIGDDRFSPELLAQASELAKTCGPYVMLIPRWVLEDLKPRDRRQSETFSEYVKRVRR
jgi:hypothetical protein